MPIQSVMCVRVCSTIADLKTEYPLVLDWQCLPFAYDNIAVSLDRFFFSTGPGAYAPDAPQPEGLLCNPF